MNNFRNNKNIIVTLECYVKCADKLYGVKEHYFILPFNFVSRHVRILFLLLSFIVFWQTLKLKHVS